MLLVPMMRTILWAMAMAGLYLDVLALFGGVSRVRRGFGASPTLIVPLILYLVPAVCLSPSAHIGAGAFIAAVVVHFLCQLGITGIYAVYFNGRGPLHRAVLGNVRSLQSLLRAGADLCYRDYAGWTPVAWARWVARKGRADRQRVLAFVMAAFETQLGDCSETANNVGLCKRLGALTATYPGDSTAALWTDDGATIHEIHARVLQRDWFGVRHQLAQGHDVNQQDEYGWAPLHDAAFMRSEAIAQLLLTAGADANLADGVGWTPLHVAEFFGYRDIAVILERSGANVEAYNDAGFTPAGVAAARGNR